MSISLNTRFTCGDCHILARAIHRVTGWPMATFSFKSGKERLPDTHAFVRLPDGRYLDIEGVRTADEMYERWYGRFYTLKEARRRCSIVHWANEQELLDADPSWIKWVEWPSSPRVAERVARRILWGKHD